MYWDAFALYLMAFPLDVVDSPPFDRLSTSLSCSLNSSFPPQTAVLSNSQGTKQNASVLYILMSYTVLHSTFLFSWLKELLFHFFSFVVNMTSALDFVKQFLALSAFLVH